MCKPRQFSYKIKKIRGVCLLTILPLWACVLAQSPGPILKIQAYRQSVKTDSLQRMVELKTIIPDVEYDLRYATADNFTGKKLYSGGEKTYLRLLPSRSLAVVEQDLETSGLGLKIWDAYRPYQVTKKMWDLVHDERYVANPSKGSGHNRGLAVDLTLIDLETGEELDMGTRFDNFTDSAHHDFKQLSPEVLANRRLLRKTMEKHGFHPLETEWWHYSWPIDHNYAVLDIDLKKMK